ncbi:tetratricopeptide repeat protein [Qipengyuania sp. GH38]|uniref:SPOR domain-containing protein n=1 Tax=Qipengyuania intermedia TaxID=2867244 RepID=UPI001C86F22F|nr:SPOR domain-containing protein [Qipengyuania intermedia]MBX7514674.1 tetratricopeptide repeat protein [Qipengyuania intermedia]
MTSSVRHSALRLAASVLAFGVPGQLAAQEIVQPLPPEGTSELNSALQRLARDSGDVGALLDAGEAALKLGDIPAAIGFFGRAQDISPNNSRVTLGLAQAYTYSRRPVEALQLFAQAERAGVQPQRMAKTRALAFDLVGDSASAQALYRLALQQGEDAAVRRNLALSQAISGDKAGFEATLLPLLQQGDNAAFRTRAFGLAVLGETEAAIQIARDMMPRAMAGRVEPYLRYMPQLTAAQQAAAGTLGVFPRTASIGRDDPAIARYDSPSVRSADAALAPTGPALGQPTQPTRPARQRTSPPRERAEQASASSDRSIFRPARSADRPARVEEPVQAAAPAATPAAQPQAVPPTQATTVATVSPTTPPAALLPQRQEEESVADAFAGFDLTGASAAPRQGAVDITRIQAPREVAEPPAPPPPAHPARHWVQVATGRDTSALRFDWRRIARKAEGLLDGKGPFVTPWVEANRLLSGPYESRDAARDVVNRLRALEIDSFPFSSDEGQEIAKLD